MKRLNLKIGITLGILGIIGVASLLTMQIPIEEMPPEALMAFGPDAVRFAILINPLILTIITVVVGTLLFQKAGLDVPFIRSVFEHQATLNILTSQIKWALPLGIVVGSIMYFFAMWFEKMYPEEFILLSSNFTPTVAMKLLYGGITEEILLRYGLMTLLVWLLILLFRKKNAIIFWTAIIIAAFLFGAGHLGVLFQAIRQPPAGMIIYVILGNAIGGVCLGWLYWKKGLEAAMFGHMFLHLAMIGWIAVF